MELMRFGRHKGTPVTEVPTAYLEWAYENMPNCPTYIIDELGKRGVMTASLWMNRQGKSGPASNAAWRKKKAEAKRAGFRRKSRQNANRG